MKKRAMAVVGVAMASMAMACGGQYEAPSTTNARLPARPAAPPTTIASAPSPSPSPSPTITTSPIIEARASTPERPRVVATHLLVKRLVVAHAVKDHEPVSPDTTFRLADAGRIYAFVEVENDEKAPGEVFVAFEPVESAKKKTAHADVKLTVGTSPRWRTWAFTRTAKDIGSWVAVVRSASGEVLARAPFEVTL